MYRTNLADVGFAHAARTMTQCPVFDFRFENIERLREIYIHNFAPMFIMDSVLKKTLREFLLDRWTPLLS